MCRPRPVLPVLRPVVKNGSKTLPMFSGGMPLPSSAKTMRTVSGRGSLTRIESWPACPSS